jgi:hypothetical protein
MLSNLTFDWIGDVHLWASVLSLITGTSVFILRKGTKRHKQIGYIYSAAMVVVLATAFGIYRLWGTFGIFHGLAILGSATLLSGMIPVLTKKPANNYLDLHMSFMYWSVIGLYAAFISEIFARFPEKMNLMTYLGSLGIFFIISNIIFFKLLKRWKNTIMIKKKNSVAEKITAEA